MAANPRRRRRRARRIGRRRRRNPALLGALPLPNFMEVGIAAAGGIGSKMLARTFLPQATGWMAPLATLGAGVGIAFVLKMLKMGQFARPVALGAGVAAATDALKMTPFGAQLGYYVAPGDVTPVLSGGGVGTFPDGFTEQIGAGNGNYPGGFEPSYDDIY